MAEKNCGNCRFYRPNKLIGEPFTGTCEFVLPDFLKKYDDDSSMRNMQATDYCSFFRKRKMR